MTIPSGGKAHVCSFFWSRWGKEGPQREEGWEWYGAGREAGDGGDRGQWWRGGRTLLWCQELPRRDKTKVGHRWGLTVETAPYSADWSLKPSYHGFSGNTNHTTYLQYTSSRKWNAKISGSLQDSIWQGTAERKLWRSFGQGKLCYTAKQSHS